MWFVHFECIMPAENASRYYRYHVEAGLFDLWYLSSMWGRIGTAGNIRQISSAPCKSGLEAALLDEAEERFQHGYELADYSLPDDVIDRVLARRPRVLKPASADRRRAEVLRRTRSLLAQLPDTKDRLLEIDALIDDIDPDRRRARANTKKRRRKVGSPGFFAEGCTETPNAIPREAIDAADLDARRELFRLLAVDLLADDPFVSRSVLRSLDQSKPYELDASNVVTLSRAGSRAASWSLEHFVQEAYLRRRDPPLPDFQYLTQRLVERLRAAGLRNVSDLLVANMNALVESGRLRMSEVRALSRACGDYGLRLREYAPGPAGSLKGVA